MNVRSSRMQRPPARPGQARPGQPLAGRARDPPGRERRPPPGAAPLAAGPAPSGAEWHRPRPRPPRGDSLRRPAPGGGPGPPSRRAGWRRPRSQVPGPRSQVPGPRSKVPGPRSKVQGPRSKVPGTRSQVPGPRSQPGTQVQGPPASGGTPPGPGEAKETRNAERAPVKAAGCFPWCSRLQAGAESGGEEPLSRPLDSLRTSPGSSWQEDRRLSGPLREGSGG